MDIFSKYAAEIFDYDVDFSRSLPDGDTLAGATVTVEPEQSMVSSPSFAIDGDIVKVWLIDGETGKTATVSVIATTVQGRTIEEQFKIRVRG